MTQKNNNFDTLSNVGGKGISGAARVCLTQQGESDSWTGMMFNV